MSPIINPIYIIFLAGISYAILKFRHIGRPRDFPPGPPTLPIIGNLHLMPSKKPHVQFKKWADEYGPIYSLILGTSVMIVLSSDQAVKDLLDKRSNIYSSRPPLYIAGKISGFMRLLVLVFMPSLRATSSSRSALTRAGIWEEMAHHSWHGARPPQHPGLKVVYPVPGSRESAHVGGHA
jgi:hypothetical protein